MTRRSSNTLVLEEFRQLLSSIPQDHNDLLLGLIKEINDENYLDLRHGERHTRNKGCTGPMCQKAVRDWNATYRRRTNQQAGRATRTYSRSARRIAVDVILDRVKRQYDKLLDSGASAPGELQTAGAA